MPAAIDAFDCIVIGSGFGGSVMTHRLAQKGRRVLLLERGRPYPPGAFPRTPLGNSTNLWDPSENLFGLFDLWSFDKFHAVVSSGLGGGSLIYANVMIRKPRQWFTDAWPPSVKREDLDPHYTAVEKMLNVTVFPRVEGTAKTRQLRQVACQANIPWKPAPLAVAFSKDGQHPGAPIRKRNRYGVTRTTCVSCGQCDAGCNTGSKNSLDLTYLSSLPVDLGGRARIETLHEVRDIRRLDDGYYEVAGVEHEPPVPPWDRSGPTTRKPFRFRAPCVVLAAGSLGSTFLLLRNRRLGNLPRLSASLGTRFSGNADYLGFIRTSRHRVLDASRGPVITSYFSQGMNDEPGSTGDGRTRYLVEDGGYPVLTDWLYELARPQTVTRLARVALELGIARWTNTSRTRVSARIADAIGDSVSSRGLMPMLGMGQDIADGVMGLNNNGELAVSWNEASSRNVFAGIRSTMTTIAEAMDAEFLEARSTGISRALTVHPLGGAPMATGPDRGVVDERGEVFGHPGLFVADGSVVPGAVGVNPALTIAALADLFADRVDDQCGALG